MGIYLVSWEPDRDEYDKDLLGLEPELIYEEKYIEANSKKEAIKKAKYGWQAIRHVDEKSYEAFEINAGLFKKRLELETINYEINRIPEILLKLNNRRDYYQMELNHCKDSPYSKFDLAHYGSELNRCDELISLATKMLNGLKKLENILIYIGKGNKDNAELEEQKEIKLEEVKKLYKVLYLDNKL